MMHVRQAERITTAIMPIFTTTMAALKRAVSVMPTTSMAVMSSIIMPAGRLTTAPVRCRSVNAGARNGRIGPGGGIIDPELCSRLRK